MKKVIGGSIAVACITVVAASAAADEKCADFLNSNAQPTPIKEAYKLVASIPDKKDEFETTKNFKLRRAHAIQEVLAKLREKEKSGTIFLSQKVKSYAWKYDADREELSLPDWALDEVPFGRSIIGVRHLNGTDGYSYNLLQEDTETTYVGANAFGAKKQIRKIDATFYGIYLTPGSMPKKIPFLRIRTPMPDAKQIAKDGAASILFGINIESPYRLMDVGHRDATFSDPIEYYFTNYYIVSSLRCSILYNDVTNKTLYTMK